MHKPSEPRNVSFVSSSSGLSAGVTPIMNPKAENLQIPLK